MDFIKQNSGVIATVALIIALVGVFTPVGKSVISSFGGVTNYDEVDATAIKVGGSNGSRVGPVIAGTGAATVVTGTVGASTTAPFDIPVTGVVSGDTVFAQFSTTTAPSPEWGATSPKWIIMSAKASTTAGFITITVQNQTGGSASFSASGIASSTNYLVLHPVSTVPGL